MRSTVGERGGGRATHDATWDNIQQYLPEIDNLYHAVDALAILFDTFDKTIFQTKWYLENTNKPTTRTWRLSISRTRSIRITAELRNRSWPRSCSWVQFMRTACPAFSGQTPVGRSTAAATTSAAATDLSKDLKDIL